MGADRVSSSVSEPGMVIIFITDPPWDHRVIFFMPRGEPLPCGIAQHLVPHFLGCLRLSP